MLKRDDRLEMSRYIDLDAYHAVEKTHPFYMEMMEAIKGVIRLRGRHRATLRVLELGAGTGLSTAELAALSGISIDAVEIDPNCFARLEKHMGNRARCFCADGAEFVGDDRYDVAVSVFAHDHVPFHRSEEFAMNLRRNLVPGGVYVMGGEILPNYEDSASRRESLGLYHRYIVDSALREGHFEVAKLEIDALRSGLESIGDFKRDQRSFETEMSSAGFVCDSMEKIGPVDRNDVGGVYVYVFASP